MRKRYQLTLTKEVVERFQTVSDKVGLPHNAMSVSLDEALLSIVEVLEALVERGGQATMGDLFHAIGSQLDRQMKK